MTGPRVHQTEIKLNDGRCLGQLTLNHPKALNALRLDMVETLQRAIDAWEARDDVVAIVIDADSDKAFCAGGDIVNLYRSSVGDGEADYPERFFTAEYRLCHDLRRLSTPCIAWGHGIVMGGGCGVFAAASHRVLTETSRLAMPEIKIGLFPDCAATWFFNRMPAYLARFLALTGASLNAADSLFAGLADHAISHAAKADVLAGLAAVDDWRDPQTTVAWILAETEAARPAAEAGEARLQAHLDTIRQAASGADLTQIVERLSGLATADDAWLAEAGHNLIAGCPVTAHLVYRQLEFGRYLSLREAIQTELAMALQCCAHPDFPEGVRALLIDKDQQPRWRFKHVAEVPANYVDRHFVPPWTGRHPLADLAPSPGFGIDDAAAAQPMSVAGAS
ncbi:enoyl-CoA hydratase/isomerase family protein [Salinisphaera sp. SPP-AMP-43]|uniref:enoyl-CoA hydratase/isomerase family protein n=1 Tax=Salinisphaera sp. SPP-AMP-43 TaxID=3121288 RepID=UPI003C6E6471